MLNGFVFLASLAVAAANSVLMDASGSLNRQIPDVSTSGGVVAVVSSPDTPSFLGESSTELLAWDDTSNRLTCRGATFASAASAPERTSLGTTSLAANAIILDGITEGDVEMDLRMSRHARTLTALMRARLAMDSPPKQTIILGILGPVDEAVESVLTDEVQSLFEATAAEANKEAEFEEMYEVVVIPIQSEADASNIISVATDAAKASAQDSTLSQVLSAAQAQLREAGVASEALDTPHVAQAFLTCRQAYAKQARTARAKMVAWRSRVGRGLCVDGFGADADALRKRTLDGYDAESLASAGLPSVSEYRLEIRNQLQELVDGGIRELFEAQVSNLEKSTLKKFQAQLLRTTSSSEESAFDDSAAAMRTWAYNFDSTMSELEVSSLGLTKDKASREMSAKLNEVLTEFPDSPQAQLKRLKQVKKTTSKERKPTQRAVDLGLDLVAMIRPDGFGSLQGFAGYQLGGNSITVGIHNDADDPQVIAQFGGVRPPLLRVQPKLRVDIEL
jgi:hypothetical protein